MRIRDTTAWAVDYGFYNTIYVRIRTEDGAEGWGETAFRRRTRSLLALIEELGESLEGGDATQLELHFERLYRNAFSGGVLLTTAISALDMALYDLNARVLEVPVYRLLGGRFRDHVPVYTHAAASATPDGFAASVKERVDAGFTAIKTTVPVFYTEMTSIRQRVAPTVDVHTTETEALPAGIFAQIAEFYAAAREAVGPTVRLMVDCHGRLNVANSLALCDALAPFDITFIEEPVPPERVEWLAAVTARSTVPIAAGERWGHPMSSAPFIEQSGISIAQPDVGICGGLTAAKKIAVTAEMHAVSIAFHNPFGPLQSAATFHLAATLPNLLICETMITPKQESYWGRYVSDPPAIRDGLWEVPDSPGLGPVPDIDALKNGTMRLEYDRGGTR